MVLIAKEILRKVREIEIRTTHMVDDVLGGAYLSAFKGRGMEFEEVREYLPGDDVRCIDWNVTARMNRPFIKNFREERELTVMLVVDISASSLFGSRESKQSMIAEIGAVLAFSAIKNHDKVGLILFSDKVEKYVPPKKGVRHVLRVIRELLVGSPEGAGTDVDTALAYLVKVQKKRGVCFLISDFITEKHSKALNIAARCHDLIGLCISDGHEQALPNLGLVPMQDLETGEVHLVDTSSPALQKSMAQQYTMRIERQKVLMEKAGASFLNFHTGQDYTQALKRYFRLRQARGR